MKYLFLLLALVSLSSCSVKKAGALSSPPETENKIFNTSLMTGEFCNSTNPTVFLWPTDLKGVDLSYEEMASSRQRINKLNDDRSLYNEEKDAIKEQIDSLFLPDIHQSKSEFKELKCYSYCNPDGWCFPDDDQVEVVDDWATPEQMVQGLDLPADTPADFIEEVTAEFAGKINFCKQNQSQRQDLQKVCFKEIDEKYKPVAKLAGDAALSLLKEVDIGAEENYFQDITDVNFSYKEGKITVIIKKGDYEFSTHAEEDFLKISDVNLDTVDGYLEFNMNAINTEEDNRIYGQFKFDLEFISTDKGFRLDGDFVLTNFDKSTEKVGRVSFSMNQKSCEKAAVITACE